MSESLRTVGAQRKHHAEFVRLFPELGVDDPVPPLERWWAEMAPDTTFIELDGQVVAYGYAQALSRTGYVRHVIVDPQVRRRGLGRAMMSALASSLRGRGCERWELNVRSDNVPAIALYESLGMAARYTTWVLRLPRERVRRLPRRDQPVRIAAIAPGLDARLEQRFAIAPGLLASLRNRSGQRLVLAGEDVAPLGAARFDPHYPGCFPFCAEDAGVARAMLEAVLPEVPADKPWIQVVVERDQRLARALTDAGAKLHFEIVHMEGALPC